MAKVTHHVLRGNETRSVEADGETFLIYVVRSELGDKSTALGCDDGTCGSCRVLVDGRIVNSCSVRWKDVVPRSRIESYDDLKDDPAAVAAVEAFDDERSTRCKLCVGGLGVTAVSLARAGKRGDPESVEQTLATATCMCTGRGSLRRALLR